MQKKIDFFKILKFTSTLIQKVVYFCQFFTVFKGGNTEE